MLRSTFFANLPFRINKKNIEKPKFESVVGRVEQFETCHKTGDVLWALDCIPTTFVTSHNFSMRALLNYYFNLKISGAESASEEGYFKADGSLCDL